MIRIFLPLICAALGFAAASCSQSDGPFAPAEAPAPPQSTSHGAAAAAMPSTSPQAQDPAAHGAPPSPATTSEGTPFVDQASQASGSQAKPAAPATTPAERRASTLIGMAVVSADSSPLGDVKDIIFDSQGRDAHLVIAYGSQPDPGPGQTSDAVTPATSSDGKLTAMPWDAAVASMKDGRLVLDGAKLQGAPSFTPDQWPNLDDPAWSTAADTYWRKAVRAAIAAHPGAPIDSTTRKRGRRTRGDDNGY